MKLRKSDSVKGKENGLQLRNRMKRTPVSFVLRIRGCPNQISLQLGQMNAEATMFTLVHELDLDTVQA
jgi:hypothetical protein